MLKKSSKRFVSIVLAIAMILTMVPFAAFADETTASDLDGHWAENVITEWMDYGIINGYEDGTIRPNNKITRAEMTAMLDRVMDYQTKADNTFSDLQDTWYTDVILKANAAGVISGYPDGTVKPDATITRQEAVAMFSRVLSLDTKNAPEATFTDNADVADWAKDAVNAMAAADYIHGSDGQFRPNDGITRAEVVTILNNIFDKLYQKAGEYTGDVDGSAVINTDQVTLKDMTISGDLIIAEGVGDGHVVLDNVTVDGKLIVRGGGENSVIIKGDSKIDNISVERIDGAVRVAVEGNASVNAVLIDNGGQDVKIEGTVDTVNVASANVNVDITGAAKDINVADTAKNATITVTSTATADNVSTSAENTTIIVAGTVSNIDIADTANNSVVTTQSSATVDKVTTAAGSTTVEGSGTVTDVVVGENASDATVTTEGTKVENNSSSNVTTGDDSVIAPGTTDTTPGGTTETPSVPSVPSGPSHTHNYVDGVCATDGAIDPSWAQVNSTATWNEAVAAGKNIVVTADFTTDAQLQITKAITVNGNGNTISAADGWTNTANENKHLLSVIGDEANNVAIKNLTLDSKNAAYGAQAYCVEGTTLTNVTLKNSNGAGLTVNGSTVTANSLTTTGNAWGGVNVDNGDNVTATPSFSFDASSNFDETTGVAVYSEMSTAIVNAPEGWACAQIDGKYYWSKLFDGGNGSEEKPYLISNMDQWNNIAYVATQGKSFLLNTDITLTSTTGMLNHFNGTLDGGKHSITLPNQVTNSTYWCAFAEYMTGTLKNIVINHGTDGIIPFIGSSYGKSLTFDNVNIGTPGTKTVCQTSTDDNNESAYLTFNESEELHFINCNNYLSYNYVGGASMYTSAFMGGYTVGGKASTITFDNCWNYGSLMMSNASLFIGNGTQMQNTTVIVTNSGNYGKIIGYQSAKPFCAISTDKFENNAAEKIALNAANYNKEQGSIITLEPLTGFSATCTDGGNITITAPTDSTSVAHYNLTYAAYGSNENGTYLFNIVIPIDKDQLATSYKKYTMISTDTAKEQNIDYTNAHFISTGSYDMKYAIQGEYIICDFGSYAGGKTVKLNNDKPSITVTAVDSNETVLGLTSIQ